MPGARIRIRFDSIARTPWPKSASSGTSASTTGTTSDDVVSVAGRVMRLRVQGKLVFVDLRDGAGELQLFVNKAELGDDAFARFVDDDRPRATGSVSRAR